jgi:hypothetical protein
MQAIENAANRVKELIREYLETIDLLTDIENTIADTGYDIADTIAASQPKVEEDASSSDSSSSSSGGGSGGGDSGPTMEDLQKQYYEQIQKEFEADLSSTERELERIDFYLDRISDDFYSMAEAAELMKSKVSIVTDNLAKYENFYNKITEDYEKMAIGGEDFEAGL